MEGTKRPRRHTRVREAAPKRHEAGEVSRPGAKGEEVAGVLLDSDVIIEILRGRRETLEEFRRIAEAGVRTYCSPVAYAEILRRLRPGEEAVTEEFFQSRGQVVIDGKIGRRAGSYLARYSRSHGLEIADAFVAACASSTGLHLWTRNRRDYPMPDLRLYEPPGQMPR